MKCAKIECLKQRMTGSLYCPSHQPVSPDIQRKTLGLTAKKAFKKIAKKKQ